MAEHWSWPVDVAQLLVDAAHEPRTGRRVRTPAGLVELAEAPMRRREFVAAFDEAIASGNINPEGRIPIGTSVD